MAVGIFWAYSVCSPLPKMSGPPHHNHLRPDALLHTVHMLPFHSYEEVKRQIDTDISRGIIEEVPAGESTKWWSSRRTQSYAKQWIFRCGSVKLTTPVTSGYHHIPFDDENCKLTTFITSWGWFCYCITPMGHCAAKDAFTKCLDDSIPRHSQEPV